MKRNFNVFAALLGLALMLNSCGGSNVKSETNTGDTLTVESQLLTLVDQGNFVVADIRNPWTGNAELLERYILVPKEYDGTLPEGTVVKVPLEKSVVYSSVHGGAIAELNAVDAIAGVADKEYFKVKEVADRIGSGQIADVGNSMSVSIEKIVDLSPDAILMSPFQNKESGAITKIGTPVVQCVDYMESTPLGRAEWIKLVGILYGQSSKADSIFTAVSNEYAQLSDFASNLTEKPTVLPEQPMPSGVWNVPAGDSYMARMIVDASVDYPWADSEGVGSLNLDAAAVLDKAGGADFWVIRSYGPLRLSDLESSNPLNKHIKAFNSGNVYVCDTSVSPLFDEFPFHPELLLREYIKMFHPAALPDYELRYFVRVN